MHQYALQVTNGTSSVFNTMHIRRGDFFGQYEESRQSAQQIYDNIKGDLEDGSVVFIATDERAKKFFNPLKKHYHIKFLDDFKFKLNPKGFRKANTNYFGLIDQLVVNTDTLVALLLYSEMHSHHALFADFLPGVARGEIRRMLPLHV
jgi:GDP-fucose protein O-fucosyltransferase